MTENPQVRRFFSVVNGFVPRAVQRIGGEPMYDAEPVAGVEVAAPDGYLPILFSQADSLCYTLEGSESPWLKAFRLQPDDGALLGCRVECTGDLQEETSWYPVLALLYESILMAKLLSPHGVIELKSIWPPKIQQREGLENVIRAISVAQPRLASAF